MGGDSLGHGHLWVAALLTGLLGGCGGGRDDQGPGGSGIGPGLDDGGSTGVGGEDDGGDDESDIRLDQGVGESGSIDCQEGEECNECVAYEHTPCDEGTSDFANAMGLNCPGEPQAMVVMTGSPSAMGTRTGFGAGANWPAREGSSFTVLGSGNVAELDSPTPPNDPDIGPTHCNDDLGDFDPGAALPAPMQTNDVGGDCTMNPALVGGGDCSNTINAQFTQGGVAEDYTEARITAEIGPENTSVSYDFAYFSTEFPWYYGQAFNDMFVGWLQSETWTGNVSFDEQGNPISLNAGFLDFQDNNGTQVPDFAGTCMKRHAGTKWLSTTAPVAPGETAVLVLGIFDMADSILDSYVFLDNFSLGCVPGEKPETKPVG